MIPKFRAWDKQLKRWTNYEITDDLQRFYGKDKDCWYCDIYNERFILLQSTGLTDINDNEIFEGDIVSTIHGLCEVKFVEDGYRIIKGSQAGSLVAQDLRVVGNIYENPELMEK
jgi:uncharacterized phage protein (TIGR01671 family)